MMFHYLMYATFPAHHILLHLIILITLVEGTRHEAPPYVVLSILLLLRPLRQHPFPKHLPHSSFKVRDFVWEIPFIKFPTSRLITSFQPQKP